MEIVMIVIDQNSRNERKFEHVQQCLANIPEGPVKVENYKIISPPKKHYKILYGKFNPIISNYYSEGIQTPKGLVL